MTELAREVHLDTCSNFFAPKAAISQIETRITAYLRHLGVTEPETPHFSVMGQPLNAAARAQVEAQQAEKQAAAKEQNRAALDDVQERLGATASALCHYSDDQKHTILRGAMWRVAIADAINPQFTHDRAAGYFDLHQAWVVYEEWKRTGTLPR